MKEILKKVRDYEIRIRQAVDSHMHGNFQSVFKGSGLEFDDVRAYEYGDDVRTIHWKITAKGNGTFVKTFKEEKEQIVFFLVDVSASQDLGRRGRKKIDISKEICSVLAFSAIKELSHTGVLAFSDRREKYIPPGKGRSHAMRIFREIFELKSSSKKTNLSKMLGYVLSRLRRKAVIILISDFIDEGYEKNLKALSKIHDLVVIHVSDPRERRLPRMGIVPLKDQESGKTIWINSSSGDFSNLSGRYFRENTAKLEYECKRLGANYIHIDTDQDYVPKLIKLFRIRNLRKKSRKK
jgi:uncharacterized protein (DUF58 family)